MTEDQSKPVTNIEQLSDNRHSSPNSDIYSSFESAEKFQEQVHKGKISTGSAALDRMVSGGIETGALTEIHSSSGCGKSQLCFTLCAIVQQNTLRGGLNGKALYIDTEHKFVPSRVLQIATARGFETTNILRNIKLARPYSCLEQENIIQNLADIIEKGKTRLVIVDSIISNYRAEFLGRVSLPERQHRLYKSLRLLANIAEIYDIAVVVTNQVQCSHDSLSNYTIIPTGGNVMAHSSTHRIQLQGTGYVRMAKIINSPSHPSLSARFIIYEAGIGDDDSNSLP